MKTHQLAGQNRLKKGNRTVNGATKTLCDLKEIKNGTLCFR